MPLSRPPTSHPQCPAATLLSNAIDIAALTDLDRAANEWYVKIDRLGEQYSPWRIAEHLPAQARYSPSASSIALAAVSPPESVLKALSPALRRHLVDCLGADPICDIDLAWLRRQYPTSIRPAVAAPHSWHQDGACGFDFINGDLSAEDALLPMLTVWIPLHHCGEKAPGLEFILDSPELLLHPEQLNNTAIAQRWPEKNYWRPVLRPGDALLIASHTLHRTYQTEEMIDFRGCVELRFLRSKALPQRLAGHRFIHNLEG